MTSTPSNRGREMVMNHTLFAVGETCPIPTVAGMQLSEAPPLVILFGLPRPSQDEIRAVQSGKVIHRLGANAHAAWMTVHVYDAGNSVALLGEVFHSAGKSPDHFTDEGLARMRADLPAGYGLVCSLVLVDTTDQRVTALRAYSWSYELSMAFLASAERTRHVSVAAVDQAIDDLLARSNVELAQAATVTFNLPAALT